MDNPQTSAIWEHKTQNEDKQNTTKQKQSIQKIKNMSNTDPTKKCMYLRIKLKTLDPCKIRFQYPSQLHAMPEMYMIMLYVTMGVF